MSAREYMPVNILVCCCANTELTAPEELQDLLAALSKSKADVQIIADLCRLVADGSLALPSTVTEPLAIIACRPRAVQALLHAAGCHPPQNTRYFDLRHQTAEDILTKLATHSAEDVNSLEPPAAESDEWQPWFPVIDRDRCVNCGQCREFCLFGVYETDDENRVYVSNPTSCKNNCPACARICPQAAIIFPKHNETPIDGAPITDEELENERIRVDVKKILGDDPYEALKQRRRKSKKRLVDRRKLDQARRERESHQRSRPDQGES